MAKRYIFLEEKNQRINEFSIGYMMNPYLSIYNDTKNQVKICMKNKFCTMTQQNISKILSKTNTRVLALVMFCQTRQENAKKMFKVLSCVIHNIINNYVCFDYLGSEKNK